MAKKKLDNETEASLKRLLPFCEFHVFRGYIRIMEKKMETTIVY